MLAVLKKYLGIYTEFIATSIAEATTYRVQFVMLIFMDLFFYASSYFSVDFIFAHVDTLGAWHRDHFLFFVAFVLVVDHIHMTFISENFWNFAYEIRTGKLDFILLKPANTIFVMFFRLIRAASFCNIFVPWALLIYHGTRIELTPLAWVAVPIGVILALSLQVCLEIIISMAMFWTIESYGINFLRMQLQQLSRWPDFIYRTTARRVFTIFVPLLLIGSAPVRYLIDQSDNHLIMLLLLSLPITWLMIAYLWRLGLKHYESASS
jgi:ABC-2 type transport system permease protein